MEEKTKTKGIVESVRLEPVDNGFILSWEERVKSKNSDSQYACCSYEYNKEVYSQEDVSKAVARMIELAKMMG